MLKKRYLVVGNGRLAKHLCHYFTLMKIEYTQWYKEQKRDLLQNAVSNSDIVLLAISDGSIESFIDSEKKLLKGKTLIHFSGALVTEKATGCHPLMTFTEELYDLELYTSILFCLDEGSPDFNLLFPELPNPHIIIPGRLKPYYHSLCVLANNFTCILWQKFYDEMIENFGAEPKNLDNFLKRTTSNIINNYKTCLTGPLARDDKETIKKNIASLNLDPFKKVYQSFVDAYGEQAKNIFNKEDS
jgi:2-dehydropantoate 2-reductase